MRKIQKWFFLAIVIFFTFQAAWIALSSHYPMAFDEDFHIGVIELYAEHKSPFWDAQPADANKFSAVFRDPSYLYHYIFSWVYNFLGLFTDSLPAKVLVMRFINIGLLVWALFIYRKLLKAMGASEGLTNFLLLIFTLVPVTSLLAGQINYDNLMIPLVGILLLWTLEFIKKLKINKFDSILLIKFLGLGFFGSLVKYPFLPIFFAACLCLLVYIGFTYKTNFKSLWTDLISSFKADKSRFKWLIVSLALLMLILCFERYGINTIRYGTPIPDCGKVMSYNECKEFGPWIRDHDLALKKNYDANMPWRYFYHDWLYGIWFRLFFAVDGPTNSFQTKGPLTVPAYVFIGFCAVSLLSAIIFIKTLAKKYGYKVGVPFTISMFYAAILWANGFGSFVKTGKPVAINGRYLLPVILPILVVGLIALTLKLQKYKKFQTTLACLFIFCMLWGGGALTFILRSNDNWYWNNSAVRSANSFVRQKLGPITPGYNVPNKYQR